MTRAVSGNRLRIHFHLMSIGSGYVIHPAIMWVDDIKIYPWRDYLADYVPEPEPINQADEQKQRFTVLYSKD